MQTKKPDNSDQSNKSGSADHLPGLAPTEDYGPTPGRTLQNGELDKNGEQARSISPAKFDAVLFDMDGVVTQTATVHFAAWKAVFDEVLKAREGADFKEFTQQDYLDYVDGKPREDGIKSLLEARKISLPEKLDDKAKQNEPGTDSVHGLGLLKDQKFMHIVHTEGVKVYDSTIALIKQLRAAGIVVGLVTASENGSEILRLLKINRLFDATITGVDTKRDHLRGKPEPDTFLKCARKLAVLPQRAVVVEDAEAGVAAGKKGHFGLVIGVARQKNEESLVEHGATFAVADLADVSVRDGHSADLVQNADKDVFLSESNWIVSFDKYDPAQEMHRESLCAMGNGKFCSRGAWAFSRTSPVHYPGTYVAGGYDSIAMTVEGRTFDREELVNMPNWLTLQFRISNEKGDGDWFDLDQTEIIAFSQRLNLRRGILYRDLTVRDKEGRETELHEQAFVHMRYSHLAGVELAIVPLNYGGHVTVRSAIDGRVLNSAGGGSPDLKGNQHLTPIESIVDSERKDVISLKMLTNETRLVVAEAARTVFALNEDVIDPPRSNTISPDYIAQEASVEVALGQTLTVSKTASLFTSRDRGIYEASQAARTAVIDAEEFLILATEQMQAWRTIWRQFDLFIECDESGDDDKANQKLIPSLLVHLNSFHTIQTASPHTVDLDTGIPPRGWTGEGYQGHIFWDDLFVFPFINMRLPNISSALLSYRYRRIGEARKIARSHGARGACFPWESASDGRERTPDFSWMIEGNKWIEDFTSLEMHVNGAIAYNVWQYFQVTNDFRYMYSYGGEVLFEIARFWSTFAKHNQERDKYEIKGVIGPDEFHKRYVGATEAGINNNAYTNVLAAWTLTRALEFLEIMTPDLRSHICERLHITQEEIELWDDVSRKMYIPFVKDEGGNNSGVISQFEGFDELAEFPGFNGTASDHPIDEAALKQALLDNDGVLNQYKICKQADVLMLMYIFSPGELQELFERLGYKFDYATMAANANYYIPRTANTSTLSRVAHAWVLSRLDRLKKHGQLPSDKSDGGTCPKLLSCSTEIFYEALGSDYYDVASRGTAATGIHLGAMAGTVDIVQRCYTGIVMQNNVLWFDPELPEPLIHLAFNMRYRGHFLHIDITADKLTVYTRSYANEAIEIGYHDKTYMLAPGDTKEIDLRSCPLI